MRGSFSTLYPGVSGLAEASGSCLTRGCVDPQGPTVSRVSSGSASSQGPPGPSVHRDKSEPRAAHRFLSLLDVRASGKCV
eukprot:6973200-Alexandrium_andersonii.AAC.1